MPFNLNSRRPPPPPPEDGPLPPPVPNRPQKGGNPVNNTPSSPPEDAPPALPQRPGRNNPPPPPQEDYEDINTTVPALISLPSPRPQPVSSSAVPSTHFSGANSGQPKRAPAVTPVKPKLKLGIRPWDSFREAGNKFLKKSAEPPTRRVTLGPTNTPDPQMLEEDEPTDYEVPVQCEGSAGSNHQPVTVTQRQNETDDNDVYEEDCWSDSEWNDHGDAEADDPPDDMYVCPVDPDQQDDGEGFYTAPDPLTPEILPINGTKQQSKGMMSVNPADLQMKRSQLSSNSLSQSVTESKSPPVAKVDTPSKTATPASPTSNVSALGKKFQSLFTHSDDKPKPPPKPRKTGKNALIPPSSNKTVPKAEGASSKTATEATPVTKKEKETKRKGSRSDDNASGGSVSSDKKNDKKSSSQLPKLTLPSATKEKDVDLKNGQASCTSPTKPVRAPIEPVAVEEEEAIYDEGVTESLTDYPWFHGSIDRKEGEKRLLSIGQVGTFLIRTSTGDPRFPYTLAIKTIAEVKNLRIRQKRDGNFAIGTTEKADEISFPNLYELVEHHRTNNVKIFRQEEADVQDEVVKLIISPNRS